MRAKFVFESLESDYQKIKEIINDNIRTAKTREKLLEFLNKIESFSEENPTITDKKELTLIERTFDNLQRSSSTDDLKTFRDDLENLAVEEGFRSLYNARENHAFFKAIFFYPLYSLVENKRLKKSLQSIELALSEKEKKFVKKYFENLEIWSDLSDKIEEIKKIITPTREQKEAKKLKEIKGKVNPEIKSAIDEIAENFRKVIESNQQSFLLKTIERFKKEFPEGLDSNKYYEKDNIFYREYIGKYIKPVQNSMSFKQTYKLVDNYEEKVKKDAYEMSVDTIAKWQFKMYEKLGGFMSELNKKFTTTVMGNKLRSNTIFFKFEDGSRFSIENQIVAKLSNLGNHFYTYPTTFHDAYLPNGEKIANPNEFTVKQAFNSYKNE